MPAVRMVKDDLDKLAQTIKKLADVQVLVGIPEDNAKRTGGKKQPSNALLGYVHENGLPEHNLPARPFLIPGVKNANEFTVKGLRKAADYALEGDRSSMFRVLNAVGMNAVSSVQRKITEGPFAPLSPATIRARSAKLKNTAPLTAGQRAAGFADIRPLIDTGQLRRSITYVIRSRSKGKKVTA